MRKKIAITTIFDNLNYGTYLQALALGIVLKNNDLDVEIVRYFRKHMQYRYQIFKTTNNPIKQIKRLLWAIKPYLFRNSEHKFVAKHIRLTKKYYSFEELKCNLPIANIYIAGSDQIWNSIHNKGIDKVYFLDYAPTEAKKCAYAASIGMNEIPEQEKQITKSLLETFDYISLREKSGIDIIENIGLNKQVYHVLDPTLLLNKQQWLSLANISFKKKEPYLLIYSVETKEQDNIIEKIAIQIAKEKKLKIYSINNIGGKHKNKYCDKSFYRISIPMFLSLFEQADYIVVSSFHGTAFSINFNKEFITIKPDRFNSRIDSLLLQFKLQRRIINDKNPILRNVLDSPIDYSSINELLDNERKKSKIYIDKMIG